MALSSRSRRGLTGRTNTSRDQPYPWEEAFTPHSHTLSDRRARAEEFGFDRHNFNYSLKPSARDRKPKPMAETFDQTMEKWNSRFAPTAEFDVHEKKKAAQEFLKANADKVQRFESRYHGMSNREVYQDLLASEDFAAVIHNLKEKARTYNRGKSSDQLRACLTRNMDELDPTSPAMLDPYVNSLQSSRTARRDAQTRIFATAYDTSKTFNRTRGTLPEYGSFSRFNSLLKANAGAVLNR